MYAKEGRQELDEYQPRGHVERNVLALRLHVLVLSQLKSTDIDIGLAHRWYLI